MTQIAERDIIALRQETSSQKGLNGHKPEVISVPTTPLRREDFKRDSDDPIHEIRKLEEDERAARAKAWAKANYGHNDRLNEALLKQLRALGPMTVTVDVYQKTAEVTSDTREVATVGERDNKKPTLTDLDQGDYNTLFMAATTERLSGGVHKKATEIVGSRRTIEPTITYEIVDGEKTGKVIYDYNDEVSGKSMTVTQVSEKNQQVVKEENGRFYVSGKTIYSVATGSEGTDVVVEGDVMQVDASHEYSVIRAKSATITDASNGGTVAIAGEAGQVWAHRRGIVLAGEVTQGTVFPGGYLNVKRNIKDALVMHGAVHENQIARAKIGGNVAALELYVNTDVTVQGTVGDLRKVFGEKNRLNGRNV